MKLQEIEDQINLFSASGHGNSDYYKDDIFVRGGSEGHFIPWKYLTKKITGLNDVKQLLSLGLTLDSLELIAFDDFAPWYKHQFARVLKRSDAKKVFILHRAHENIVWEAIAGIHKGYELLKKEHIILNGKNLPIQLGEWYVKNIFGLTQQKSPSQRNFDFYMEGKRVEVKVFFGDVPTPKGVKIKKSLVQLSQYTIIAYLSSNFMLRELCFLDSEYVLRKFSAKGHTIFLKESEVMSYFFSKSNKHCSRVVNAQILMKYSVPTFAMKLAEHFE